MRVLFTCVVGYGHFHPMAPLARALAAAGHAVAVATDPGFCGYVRSVGFEAIPAGLDHVDARTQFFASHPDWDQVPQPDRMAIQQAEMFGRIRVPPMLDDLEEVIPSWRPDLLIHDSLELAGAIAAERAGVAHAEHAVGILRPIGVRRAVTAALAPFSTAIGVRNPGVGGLGGELYLDNCPPSLQLPEIRDVPRVVPVRPVGFDPRPGEPLPDWITRRSGRRPLVYVTLGTVFNQAVEVFQTILEGLRRLEVDVIVTVGEDVDPDVLGRQPGTVHVVRYLPQERLLSRCDVMVSHGGSGAVLGAATAGVPMLVIPQGADQFLNASRVEAAGLGLVLGPDALATSAVRDAVARLLGTAGYRLAARSERSAIERMPEPGSVVPILEAHATAPETSD